DGVHLAVGLEKRHHIVLSQHGQAALGLQVGQASHAYPLALRGLRLPLYGLRHTTPPFLSMPCFLSKEKTLENHTPCDWLCKDFFFKACQRPSQPEQLPWLQQTARLVQRQKGSSQCRSMPRGRGRVKLRPLRRRRRGERAPVKLGALCPRSGREESYGHHTSFKRGSFPPLHSR